VDAELRGLLDFFEVQRAKQARHFPTLNHDQVLTFMGTTSLPGTYAAVSICPIVGMEPGSSSKELRVHLKGPLPRAPAKGECISVHVTQVDQYQGFQIKTRPLPGPEGLPSLCEASGADLTVKGSQVFTVHHSPYTMKFFEQIPFEEVQQTVGNVRFALVGVGEQANISPRFVYQPEVRLGRLVMYHGDGLALKTYVNLRSNRQVTRLALDLDDFHGYELKGTVEEFQPHQSPEAYERICQGFTAGNWGKPSRTFRFTVDTFARIAPTGPAVATRAI